MVDADVSKNDEAWASRSELVEPLESCEVPRLVRLWRNSSNCSSTNAHISMDVLSSDERIRYVSQDQDGAAFMSSRGSGGVQTATGKRTAMRHAHRLLAQLHVRGITC